MSYSAKVYNVMIASPSDVQSERNIAREVIHEWNAIHSEQRQIVLQPVGWDTHSSPEMGARPQEIINRQVLEKCDLLIGIFWTRIGTASGEYQSGTVEEIERHLDAGRPTMLYFSQKPVVPKSIDSEQYDKVKEFEADCLERGLCESYDDLSSFKDKIFRQLQLKLNDERYFGAAESDETGITTVEHALLETPSLSSEAETLLIEASMDRNGMILFLRTMGGAHIQTNGKNLIPSNDRRTVATWEAALEELEEENLVVARGDKGEIFELTSNGYALADVLKGSA